MKTFAQKARETLSRVRDFEKSENKEGKRLPSDCYFLSEDDVLCYKRKLGDGRYPYAADGRTLWAYSSGNISVEESLYNIFLDSREGKEPFLCFFTGEKKGEGEYFPVSLLGVARQPVEKDVKRYTVFTPQAVYYCTETPRFDSVVRAFVDGDKRLCFSVYVENVSRKEEELYIAAYFNPFMRYAAAEGFENKWYKACEATEYGHCFKVTEYISRESCLTHYMALAASNANRSATTSRFEYTGGMNESLNCATSLHTGTLESKTYSGFTDMAVMADICPLVLKSGENHCQHYVMAVSDDKAEAENLVTKDKDVGTALDEYVAAAEEQAAYAEAKTLGLRLSGLEGELCGRDEVFNDFIRNVVRQVEFCARAKNYAGPFIGIRDIFQQVEAAIAWIPKYCRGKIVEALNFIGEDGRPPRQYSYPANEKTAPQMDLRAFIDQGVWIISTVYTYLTYTGDYSILDEVCGYYKFVGNEVLLCDKKDSVLQHLITITDYLLSNVDENTGCLKALYGDWNDALDGLGKTKKAGREFGNGVSVMASLQLFRNLGEMSEILCTVGKNTEKAKAYAAAQEKLKDSLVKNAIVSDGNGNRKILHGWGDDRSWFVGSYQDSDGYSRDGLTTNAYWILSGMHKEYAEILPDILKAYERLDSKYGLKTFEPYFPPENDKVGRINRLPKGTAENGATYIHATLFAIWSLFHIGEAEKAWEQIYKILPITHDFISTTPFVMPNSYLYNEEKGFDGESMSDWFTGSGCVLVKALIGGAFGVKPSLDGVTVQTAAYMPCKRAEVTLNIKGTPVRIVYKKTGAGKRAYAIDAESVALENGIFIPNSSLDGKTITVEITD
ncbi:MAG: hypothetical protein IJV83_03415 [Clostridia bacterium]|nr:hypothetical protein [Clostridia bacterium]